MASGDDGEPDGDPPEQDPALAKTAPTPDRTRASVSAAEGLGQKPGSDRIGRAVARARIANKLFATQQRVELGRYHLLEMVGSGGMGVVWGAFDPELDRRVAIKLVKATMQAARDRILLEGQSLAKLSHPNVVPVYDVGVVDEQVYLVMEWVRGKNLRVYCKEPRTIREILAVYRAAGEGLSAAHRAGLIHRDFKPDNAMIGDDGRVRVLDFGLARGEVAAKPTGDGDEGTKFSSDLTRGAGTPRYMPVEQAEGEALTPAVDQYAFCVSVREALVGRDASDKDADVPGWLDAILTRGTARLAADRFASMDELLRALARDPATLWRRRLVVVGALGVAGVAFAVGSVRGGEARIETCVGGADEIAKTWNPTTRATLTAHLQQLAPYGIAEAKRLVVTFDDHGVRWADAHQAACRAQERGELTATRYEQNLGCLARTRVALDTIVEVLTRVSQQDLPGAVAGASGLPSPALCLTETQASTIDPPAAMVAARVAVVDREVARARMLALAQDREATEVAKQTVEHAEPLKYAPLIARARLEYGNLLGLEGKVKDAITMLQAATTSALEAHDDDIAVEAYARLVYVVAGADASDLAPGTRELLSAAGFIEAIATRLGASGAFARSLFFNNMGTVELSNGHNDKAIAWFERALAAKTTAHEKRAELNVIWGNLALAVSDPKRREELLERRFVELQELRGEEHPDTLVARVIAAMTVGDPERSTRQLVVACDRLRELHPHLVAHISDCSFEIGWLEEEQGHLEEAARAMKRVTFSENGEPGREMKIATGYLQMLDHRHAEAVVAMTALAEELAKHEQFFAKTRSVDAAIVAASSLVALERKPEARKLLERSLALLEGLDFLKSAPFYQRRLARVRTMLARLAPNPKAARGYAAPALEWYRIAGGYERVAAELTAMAAGSY